MFQHYVTVKTAAKLKTQLFSLKRSLSSQHGIVTDLKAPLPYKLIPRPSVLSFIRDFMPGGEFKDASFFDYTLEMRKRLGDIYVLPGLFGKSDIVMVFNTKDIETVYRNEGQWPRRPIFESVKHFREEIKGNFFKQTTGLPIAQGEDWAKMRTAVNPVLMRSQNLNMYIRPLQELSKEFILRIKELRHSGTLKVPSDFDKELYRFVFESISLVALNRKLGFMSRTLNDRDAERLIECTNLNFEFVFKLDLQPSMWKFIRTPTYYKNLKVQEDILRITQKYVNETLNQKRRGKSKDVMGILEKLLMIDEKLAVVTAMDMLTVGVDASNASLIATLLCLAKNPDKQQKLREEILKVMPTKETELNANNMKNMPYLRAVIKESLRYYPNGTGPLRSPTQDIVLSGYEVPKGTTVIMNANCLLKDDTFFPQADKFIPERWLRDENNVKQKLDPFSYLPFGIGPRICVGKRLAELKLEVAILNLLRNFEIEFNYDASKPFKASFLNTPAIPMRFTFKDIHY